MRIDPAEFAELPLPAALLDRAREPVAQTPEWRGMAPGAVSYHAGHGHLVVGAPEPADAELQPVLRALLEALESDTVGLGERAAAQRRLLAAGLRLVAGEPVTETGAGNDVIDLAEVGIAARTEPPLRVLRAEGPAEDGVPGPAVIALALVQLAVNAARHERGEGGAALPGVALRVEPGPAFQVEWPGRGGGQVRTQRHVRRRERWGLGYVRMAADALGGSHLPPAPVRPGVVGTGLSLGGRNLTLPLACWEQGGLTRRTRAWDQELHDAHVGPERWTGLVEEAIRRPGEIVGDGMLVARAGEGLRVWLAIPPELGADRVADVLRGLDHERLLLHAPEPGASRLHALNLLLRHGLGEELPTCYASEWRARFPAACRALGISPPEVESPVRPDPVLTAWLLAEFGGSVYGDAEGGVWFRAGRRSDDPALRILRSGDTDAVRLTRGIAF